MPRNFMPSTLWRRSVLTKPRIADIIPSLTAKYPTPFHLTLRMVDLVIGVSTNSQALHGELTAYFEPFCTQDAPAQVEIFALQASPPPWDIAFRIKPPEPGKTKIKEEWIDLEDGRVVRKRLTGMEFLFGAQSHLAIGDCETNPNQIINFINNRFLEYRLQHEGLLAHAAAVLHKGRGIALAGFSGMGKSTLALHLVTQGATLVSNDRLVFSRHGERLVMYGVAKHPRINPGTILGNPALHSLISKEELEYFAALSPDALWTMEHKFDAPIHTLFGHDRFQLSAPVHCLVLLNWQRSGNGLHVTEVDLTQRPDLMPAFMKDPGLFFLSPTWQAPTPKDYIAILQGCPVFEITGKVDFAQATQLLEQELGL